MILGVKLVPKKFKIDPNMQWVPRCNVESVCNEYEYEFSTIMGPIGEPKQTEVGTQNDRKTIQMPYWKNAMKKEGRTPMGEGASNGGDFRQAPDRSTLIYLDIYICPYAGICALHYSRVCGAIPPPCPQGRRPGPIWNYMAIDGIKLSLPMVGEYPRTMSVRKGDWIKLIPQRMSHCEWVRRGSPIQTFALHVFYRQLNPQFCVAKIIKNVKKNMGG